MTHPLLAKIQSFLQSQKSTPSQTGTIGEAVLNNFKEACSNAFSKQFLQEERGGFTIRMSNIGAPLCQLKMERDGNKNLDTAYNKPLVYLYGDILEAVLISVMKTAGINIVAQHTRVSVPIGGTVIEGTLDVEIDEGDGSEIWDIKTASDYAFTHKFSRGFKSLFESDTFGYVEQGVLYGLGSKKPFKGWIVINKETGEVCILEVPENFDEFIPEILKGIDTKIRRLLSQEAFSREFTDEEEKFYKKLTGNRKLSTTCSYCPHKFACWKDVQYMPRQCGDSLSAPWVWYTHVEKSGEKDAEVE